MIYAAVVRGELAHHTRRQFIKETDMPDTRGAIDIKSIWESAHY